MAHSDAKPSTSGCSQGSPEKEAHVTPTDQSKSTSYEFPPHEFSAENIRALFHGQGGAQICSHRVFGPRFLLSSPMDPAEVAQEIESGDFTVAGWSDFTVKQLEELVLSYLHIHYKDIIRNIMPQGYTEEAATKAFLRAFYSDECKGSNMMEYAIKILRTHDEKDIWKEFYSEDLQKFKRSVLDELVGKIRALRPSFSTGDALWFFLICDVNVDMDTLPPCTRDSETVTSYNAGNAGPSNHNSSLPAGNKPETEIKTKESGVPDPGTHITSPPPLSSAEPSVSGLPDSSSIPTSLVSEKRIKLNVNDVDNTFNVSGSSKMLASEENFNTSRKAPPSISSKSETGQSLYQPRTKDYPLLPFNGRSVVPGTTYDESLLKIPTGQFSGSDATNSVITKLLQMVHELESQLEEWNQWTNQKVSQATCRLKEDKVELKWLREVKEGAEKLKMKKLCEMENALRRARRHVEHKNATFKKLEVENSALRKQMETAKSQSVESDAKCREEAKRNLRREMDDLRLENQHNSLQAELMDEKRKFALIQQELGNAKDALGRVVARLEQERKATEYLKMQVSLKREEIEQVDAMAKSEDEATKLRAENSLQKHEDDIRKLQREISLLKSNKDSSKMATFRQGIDERCTSESTYLRNDHPAHEFDQASVPPKNADNVPRNRECVMCLAEGTSVVFLPCAHQVVCAKCNKLHEDKGGEECPSCRSPIRSRVVVHYAEAKCSNAHTSKQ